MLASRTGPQAPWPHAPSRVFVARRQADDFDLETWNLELGTWNLESTTSYIYKQTNIGGVVKSGEDAPRPYLENLIVPEI